MTGFLPSVFQLRLRLHEAEAAAYAHPILVIAVLSLLVALFCRRSLTRCLKTLSNKISARSRPPTDFSGVWLNVTLSGDPWAFYAAIGVAKDEIERFAAIDFGVHRITHRIQMDAARITTTINHPSMVTLSHVLDGKEHVTTASTGAQERYTAVWESGGALLLLRQQPSAYDWRRSLRAGEMVLELMAAGGGPTLTRRFVRTE